MLTRFWLPASLLLCLAGCREIQQAKILRPGAKAPEVVGESAAGTYVKLSGLDDEAVVYFYPKDDTPGCTKEACAFRDWYERYEERGVTIFGVSRDDAESHRAFRKKHGLPFVLVADVDGKVAEAYGVPQRFGVSRRMTFLVDEGGTIARVWTDVDPGVHAEEVLEHTSKR